MSKQKHEFVTPPSGTRTVQQKPKSRTRQYLTGCGVLITVCLVMSALGAIGTALNIIPDATERAQTRTVGEASTEDQAGAFNATRNAQLTNTANARPTTLVPSMTTAPRNTPRPSPTETLAPTFTEAIFLLPTNTTRPPTIAPTFTASNQTIITPMSLTTYYAGQNGANLRSCASSDCERITQVQAGAVIIVNGAVNGTPVDNGSPVWYLTSYQGRDAYVYSGVVSTNAPAVNAPVIATNAPASVTCPGFEYTCSQLTCAQAYACLAAGNDQLDGNNDTIPCNAQCG